MHAAVIYIETHFQIEYKQASQTINKDPGLLVTLPIGFETEPKTLTIYTSPDQMKDHTL